MLVSDLFDHGFALSLFLFSVGGQPLERNFEACVCTNTKGKPVVHHENPKKSQVSLLCSSLFVRLFSSLVIVVVICGLN